MDTNSKNTLTDQFSKKSLLPFSENKKNKTRIYAPFLLMAVGGWGELKKHVVQVST